MGQTWEDLAFLHWPVSIDELRAVVPPQLPIDTFDGRPWLGITPFVVRGLRLRATPPLPVISSFPELNVRTYVTLDGKPGIYFLSLDAASRVAVSGARLLYRLPYYAAKIDVERVGERMHYRSRRRVAQSESAELDAEYAPTGPIVLYPAGSLEHWLTERYCLYTFDERLEIQRADIHHPPLAASESARRPAPQQHGAGRRNPPAWGPSRPLRAPPGRSDPVSYTHLTLPTTPYV